MRLQRNKDKKMKSVGKAVGSDIVQTSVEATIEALDRLLSRKGDHVSDPKTISEKIMSAKSGTNAHAGQIVEAEIDYMMANDVTASLALGVRSSECEPMKNKIVLIPDHFVPNKDIASAEQAAEMRRFVEKYGLPNYFEVGRGGVCHQVMIDEGFAAPGRLIVGADSHTWCW